MRRRTLLCALLSGLAGCATLDSGGRPESTTTAETTRPPTTTTGESCTPVQTGFDVPSVSRPTVLGETDAIDAAYRIERAYQDWLSVDPADLSAVPADAGPYDYSLVETLAETYTANATVAVTVTAMVGYSVTTTDTDGEPVETAYDRPVAVAVYEVSPTGVIRQSGVGDLTGQLRCW